MAEQVKDIDVQIHGLIGLIYEAAMDVDLWPMLLRNLCNVLESPEEVTKGESTRTPEEGSDDASSPSMPGRLPEGGGEADIAGLIRSHFARALQLNQELGGVQHRSTLFAQLLERFPLGLALLSSEGEILQHNQSFDALLHHDRRMAVKQGRLWFREELVQQRWRKALNGVNSGEETKASFRISDLDASPLSGLLLSYPDNGGSGNHLTLLCLAAPGLLGHVAETDLALLFQLTRAESQLLAALVNGYSLDDYSHEKGLSRHTLRAQVKSLFRKTGTHRQEELVRQVLHSPALIAGSRHNPEREALEETPLNEERLHQGFRLTDGRWMSFAEYGPEGGRPVLYVHGIDGSRLQTHPDHSTLFSRGIRLIVPDRPGFGMSDFDENRTVISWADDVKQLLDRLGLEKVSVVGFSAGGVFSLALGKELSERVNHISLVSSVAEVNRVADLEGMAPRDRMIFTLCRHMPTVLTPILQLMVKSMRNNPQQYFDDLLKYLPPFERHYLRHPAMKSMFIRAFHEGTRNGVWGLVYELLLISQPFGFSPTEVEVPVRLWHGREDQRVPLVMSLQLAERLPRSETHILEDSGHFLIYDRWSEIMAQI